MRDNIAKRPEHIPRHKTPSPFTAQSDGGLQLALFRVEALVAVVLHVEKLNVLPGLEALLVLSTGRTGSPILLRDLWDGQCLYRTSRLGASKESVMVGNRGLVVEGHHSLTSCFTKFTHSYSLQPLMSPIR